MQQDGALPAQPELWGLMGVEDFKRFRVHYEGDWKLEKVRVEVGACTEVTIEKTLGPLIACDVRIRLDTLHGQWIVERQCIRDRHEVPRAGEGGCLIYDEGQAIFWEEVARFDCQDSIDFMDDGL